MAEIFTTEIPEMNALGNGIVRRDGCVVFCIGAVDGDTVTAEITEEKKNYKIARVLSSDKPSVYRTAPDCPYFGSCGGCTLRHITYEHELAVKKASIEAAARRAGISLTVDEILSASPLRCRNKAVFHFENGKSGFFEAAARSFTETDDCLLCPDVFTKAASFTAEYFGDNAPSYLYLRTNSEKTEIIAVLGQKKRDIPRAKQWAAELTKHFPAVCGVLCGVGEHPEEQRDYVLLCGKNKISQRFCSLDIEISAESFFQVNYAAAELLCRKAAEMVAPAAGECGADLYCGTGILSLTCASLYPEAFITGVEINESAVADAKENARRNALSNLGYYCGDSADFTHSAYGSLDFVIIDPPRAGCSGRLLKDLLKLKPSRILYVSCAPDTLSRDLASLTGAGYKINKAVACDLFPRTKHIETIVLLTRS